MAGDGSRRRGGGNTFDLGGPFYLDRLNRPVWVKSRRLLFFFANDGQNGVELWRSDGTASGTFRLTDVQTSQASQPDLLTEHRGKVYFAVPEPRGWTLWTSDGTMNGTKLVKDVVPYGLRSTGSALLFFGAGARGRSLWRSDGTAKGTVRVATIAEPRDLEVVETTALGGRFYFTTRSQIQGEELWTSDGTRAGTRRLTRFAYHWSFHYGDPRVALRLPALTPGARMVFAADDGVHGIEPWVTDGTPAGTRLLRDICPGACWSLPSGRNTLGQRLIFAARTNDLGQEPWVTDGTPAGTRLLRDICPGDGTGLSAIAGHVQMGGSAFLSWFTEGRTGLWRTDGTAAGTVRLSPDGLAAGDPVKVSESRLFFIGNDEEQGRRLWTSDGTAAGTRALDVEPVLAGWDTLPAYRGSLYFPAEVPGAVEVWKSDGTAGGTAAVPFLADLAQSRGFLGEFGGRLWFNRRTEDAGLELWSTDGTEAGTLMLGDLAPGTDSFVVGQLFPAGSRMFLVNDSGLWVSDGTPAGTRRIGDPTNLGRTAVLDGRLFFLHENGRRELWVSDGTEAGTRLVLDAEGEVVDVQTLVAFAGRIWYVRGGTLWRTDGTTAGTVEVAPGLSQDPLQTELVPAGNRLFYPGWTAQAGWELWAVEP